MDHKVSNQMISAKSLCFHLIRFLFGNDVSLKSKLNFETLISP